MWIVPCALARNVGTMLGWRASLAAWPAARFFWLRAGRWGTCLRGVSVDANDGIHGRAVRWVSRRSLSAAKGAGRMNSRGRTFMVCIISSGVPRLSLVGLDFEDGLGYAGVRG